MTWKDELSQAYLSRESFYHVAIASDKVLAITGASSVTRRTFSMRRHDRDFVVFCFAKPQDAEAFCEQFGGERLVPHLLSSGDNVAAPSPSAPSGLEAASRLGSDRAQREEFRGVVPSRKPHPTEDEYRALQCWLAARAVRPRKCSSSGTASSYRCSPALSVRSS